MIPGSSGPPPAPKDPAAQAHARRTAAAGSVRTVATIVQALPLEELRAERERLVGEGEASDPTRRRLEYVISLRELLDDLDREEACA